MIERPSDPPTVPDTGSMVRLGRRRFLGLTASGVAGAVMLGCGSDSGGGAGSSGPSFDLLQRFHPASLVPGEVRVPITLIRDADFVNDGPDTLAGRITDSAGEEVTEVSAVRRDTTPAAYYAFTASLDATGVYSLNVDGGPAEGAQFQLFEPSQVAVPLEGEPFPALSSPTPTAVDSAGVDPICTREPPCPFHELTLDEALGSGRHVAFLVGTPAFCSTGTCVPALESLIEVAGDDSDRLAVVHAEVYTSLDAQELSPTVQELALPFEPVLFVIGPDGTLLRRLDAIWESTELREIFDAAIV